MKLTVTFTVDISDDASFEEIQEWLEFELGARGGMTSDNPLDGDIEAISVIFDEGGMYER